MPLSAGQTGILSRKSRLRVTEKSGLWYFPVFILQNIHFASLKPVKNRLITGGRFDIMIVMQKKPDE